MPGQTNLTMPIGLPAQSNILVVGILAPCALVQATPSESSFRMLSLYSVTSQVGSHHCSRIGSWRATADLTSAAVAPSPPEATATSLRPSASIQTCASGFHSAG